MFRFLSLFVLTLTLFIATGCDNGGGSNNNFGGSSSIVVTIPTDGPGGVNGTAFVTTPSGAAAEAITTLPYTFLVTVTGVTSVGGRFSATLDTSTGTANHDGLFVTFSALTPIAPGVFQSTGTVSGGFTGIGTVTMTVTYREDELELVATFIIDVIDPGACTAGVTFAPVSPGAVFVGGNNLSVTVTETPTGGVLALASQNTVITGGSFSLAGNTLTFDASTATAPGVATADITYDASGINPFCTLVTQTYTVNVLPTSFPSGPLGTAIPDGSGSPGAGTPVVSTITVPTGAPAVTDVRVLLDITHTWVTDLRVTLTSPASTTVVLAENGATDLDDMAVVFDDNDPNGLDITSPILGAFLGSAPPRVPFLSYLTADNINAVSDLNAFIGEAMTGDWILTITDYVSADTGTLNEWTLAFNFDVTDIPVPSTLTFDTAPPASSSLCSAATVVTTCTVSPTGGTFSLGVEDINSGATSPFSIDPTTGDLTYDPSTGTINGVTDSVEVIYTPLVGLPSLAVFDVNIANGAATFLDTPGLAIPDGTVAVPSSVSDTITVTGVGCVSSLRVGLGITHTWRDDVLASLTSPLGTTVVLFDDIPSGGDDHVRVIFDDTAAADILTYTGAAFPADSPTYTSFLLFNPVGTLSSFNTQPADGTWTLTVGDDSVGITGTLDRWALAFNGDTSVF